MQFTKLFSCILDSTIWQEPPQTKILWITMLAMSDRNGEVHASVPGLAKRAGITLEECERGIACLMAPDPYSRTKDHDGRRVGTIDGGWALLNHAKYRALLSAEERREYNRQKQAEHRANKKASAIVNDSQSPSALSAHTEAEAEADKNTPLPPKGGDLPLLAQPVDKPEASAPPKAKGPLLLRAERIFHRRESTPLTRGESRAMANSRAAIEATTEGDWQALERFYAAPQSQTYARKDLSALLNNWNGEIDRAKAWMGQAPAGSPVKAFVSPEPPNWRAIIDREFPKSAYAGTTTPWDRLSVSDRDCIAQAIKPYLTAA